MPDTRYMSNPDIICSQAAAGSFLLNLDTGVFQGVNGTGLLIWQMLSRPRTPAEITACLVRECDPEAAGSVPSEQVAADVMDFLRALQPGGFIGIVMDEAADPGSWAAAQPPAPGPANAAGPAVESSRSESDSESDPEFGLSYYRGRSMLGLFRPGDILAVEPAPMAALRPGDVVMYRGGDANGQPVNVVHRVISVRPGGLETRGDNNPGPDPELVKPENVLGRVTGLERGGRPRRVRGGSRGLLLARARRAWRAMVCRGFGLALSVGRWPYRWLRESGLARRFWRPSFTRLALVAPAGAAVAPGPLIKYVRGRRTVAWWRPASGRFRCRKPYDLVILRHV